MFLFELILNWNSHFMGTPFLIIRSFFIFFSFSGLRPRLNKLRFFMTLFSRDFFPKKFGWKRRGTVLSPWIPDLIPFLWKIICNGIFQYLNVKLQNVIWGQMSNSILSPFYAIFIEVEIWWTRFHDLYKPSISLLAKMIQRKIWSTDFQIENDWDGLNPHLWNSKATERPQLWPILADFWCYQFLPYLCKRLK